MWRFPKRAGSQVARLRNAIQADSSVHHGLNKLCPLCFIRLYATPIPTAAGGGALRFILGFLGASAAVTGGTVAYAKLDDGFRAWLENSVPYSNVALAYVLGESETDKLKKIQSSASGGQGPTASQQSKEKAVPSSLLQKKLEREAAQRESAAVIAPTPAPPISQPAPMQSQKPAAAETSSKEAVVLPKDAAQKNSKADVAVAAAKSISDADIQSRLAGQDAVSAAENSTVEMLVKHSVHDLTAAMVVALAAYQSAIDSVNTHTASMRAALDVSQGQSQDEAWKAVESASSLKSAALSDAEYKGLQARLALQKVKSVIDDGRKSKIVATNPSLVAAEEAVNEALTHLQKAELEVSLIESESKVLADYKSLVEQSTSLLQAEIKNMKPQAPVGEAGKKLSEEELCYLVAHAHLKIEHLKKQLEHQQTSEKARLQQSFNVQRREYEKLVGTKINQELEQQQRELQIAYQKRFNELNEEFETELLQQLRRQAAAHSEHLRDVVVGQRRELESEYEQLVEDRIGEARHEFQRDLAGSLGRLKGIESGLKERSDLERATRRAQQLWVACQALQHSIHKGKPDGSSLEDRRKPLATEIGAISKAAGPEDAFVRSVLNSIAEDASRHGVFTEDAIKDRFLKVDTVCRRVALLKDHGAKGSNLFMYALSYLQSMMVENNSPANLPKSEADVDALVDVSSLDTFALLDRARWFVDRDNLEQALRYVNQLRGVPRQVARDWIRETRLLLEVKQAADALLARAAATEVQAIATGGAVAAASVTNATKE